MKPQNPPLKQHTDEANEKQVGGSHYSSKIQHWDYVVANDLDYFQAQITKYVTRWRKKNGIEDLLKAAHFLDKYIEVEQKKAARTEVESDNTKLKQEQYIFMRQEAFRALYTCRLCSGTFWVPGSEEATQIWHQCILSASNSTSQGYINQD